LLRDQHPPARERQCSWDLHSATLLEAPRPLLAWVRSPAGLVETSSNLAAVRCAAEAGAPGRGECAITCSSRSSLMPALEAVRVSIAKLAALVRPALARGLLTEGAT
jgi:hypothetical protein